MSSFSVSSVKDLDQIEQNTIDISPSPNKSEPDPVDLQMRAKDVQRTLCMVHPGSSLDSKGRMHVIDMLDFLIKKSVSGKKNFES